jgi:DNA polymerase I-like protein with 3'-5' exonuclease and polymerase domains
VADKLAQLGVELPRTKPSKKFPDGQLSVAEGVLDPIVDEGGPAAEFARQVLIHREHSTALSLFLRPYKVLCEHGDGRARPTVYTLGTNTGRMSCVRPNMQQLPRAGGFRAMVTADPGEMMISADFSGVELRVAAALSGDPALTRLIAAGGDLHAEVALMVFNDPDPVASAKRGRPWPKKAHRYKVKSGVFGRLYGGGAPTLAGQMGVRLDVAQRMIDVLDDMLPTLSAWSNDMRRRVQRGYTQFQAYNGRVIHLPAAFPHKAPNYGIQGNARELLVDALVNWSHTKWGKCRLLPVHDEIDVWVPAEDAEEATQMLVACMATELNGVKIVAEPSEPSFAWQDSE